MQVQPRTVGRYRRLDKIGYGNFGVVYKGIDTVSNRVVAIKTLNLDTADDEVESVRHEVALLSHLSAAKSSNVTRYYGTVLDGPRLWVIMDLCSGGSVRTLLRAGALEERYLSVLFREIVIGVAAIHSENIIHRDLKAANVLITLHGHVKLCDFGVAAVSQLSEKAKRNTVVGTPYWMAPEVIQEGQFYTNKADIWSLGITFYEIVTGNPPYAENEAMRALMLITNSRPPRLEGPKYPPALKDLVALCLDEDPVARPPAEDLLKHKFLKQHAKVSTTVLRSVVERYMQWKRARQDHRDSLLMFNPHPDEESLELSDSDSLWDFGIDGESAQLAAKAAEPDDMASAPNSLRELYGVPLADPGDAVNNDEMNPLIAFDPPQLGSLNLGPHLAASSQPSENLPEKPREKLASQSVPHLDPPTASQNQPLSESSLPTSHTQPSSRSHSPTLPAFPGVFSPLNAHGSVLSPLHSRTPSLQTAKTDDKIYATSFMRHRSTTVSAASPSVSEHWKSWRQRHDSDPSKRLVAQSANEDAEMPLPLAATAPVSPANSSQHLPQHVPQHVPQHIPLHLPQHTPQHIPQHIPPTMLAKSRRNSETGTPSPVLAPADKTPKMQPRPARAALPQLQMPARPSFAPSSRVKRAPGWPSEFPPMPQADLNSFLDSTPDNLVASTLLELITGFKAAVASLSGQFE